MLTGGNRRSVHISTLWFEMGFIVLSGLRCIFILFLILARVDEIHTNLLHMEL